MRKMFLAVLAVLFAFSGLCFSHAAASGIDARESLRSKTTQGLYDRQDVFDLTLQPGLLYQVDRWNLYTNLSAYENKDHYLIGVSGQIGPGSLGFFIEHYNSEMDHEIGDTSYTETEFQSAMDPDENDHWPNYDGRWDRRTEGSRVFQYEHEDQTNNLYLSYGMDFDWYSLGASFAPQLTETTRTYAAPQEDLPRVDLRNIDPFDSEIMDTIDFNEAYFDNVENISFYRGMPFQESSQGMEWHGAFDEYIDYDEYNDTRSWNAEQNQETDIYPLYVQSLIRMDDALSILAGVGYATIDVSTDFKARYRSRVEEIQYAQGEEGDSRVDVQEWTVNIDGAMGEFFDDADRDGDRFRIYAEPNYVLNNLVTLRLNAGFAIEDGDLNTYDGYSQTVEAFHSVRESGELTELWELNGNQSGAFSGDYDRTELEFEPRVYFDYDPVRLSLGLGFKMEDLNWDGGNEESGSLTFKYDDLQGETTHFERNWAERQSIDAERTREQWRFPVATEFDITDKLMARAGAAYYHVTTDTERKTSTETMHSVYEYVVKDEDGEEIASGVGPQEYYETADAFPDDPIPYNNREESSTDYSETSETKSYVEYRLGLGYAFTENLQFDLMWERLDGEGVQLDEVFASATFSF